jgi:alpha-L-rhamnosidase
MHTHIGGIRLDPDTPAYRRFRVAPVPGGDLTWARARLESPYGPIATYWRKVDDEQFELEVTVPPGTTADVELPGGRVESAGAGQSRFTCSFAPITHPKD